MNDLELLNSFDILENMQNSIEEFLEDTNTSSANEVFQQVAELESKMFRKSNNEILNDKNEPVDGWSDKYLESDKPTGKKFEPDTCNNEDTINNI